MHDNEMNTKLLTEQIQKAVYKMGKENWELICYLPIAYAWITFRAAGLFG